MHTDTHPTPAAAPVARAYDVAPLHEALCIIAGRCNYAATLDGAGFSRFDADFGHKLASMAPASWSPKMTKAAYNLARKYRKQLAGAGRPFENLEAPPEPDAPPPAGPDGTPARAARPSGKLIRHDGETFVVEFPYDPALVEAVKRIPGARFTRNPLPGWTLPATPQTAGLLRGFAETHTFELADTARPLLTQVAPVAAGPDRCCDVHPVEAEALALRFPYNPDLAQEARRFGTWEAKLRVWRMPIVLRETVEEALALLRTAGFVVTEAAAARVEAVLAGRERSLAQSRAEDAEPFEIPGLVRQPRPFQWAGIRYGLEKQRLIIADEMGLGKTMQAIAIVLAAKAFPAAVVCPATLKVNWKREFALAAPHLTVEIVDGMTPKRWVTGLLTTPPDVIVVNYDILEAHVDGLRELGVKALICDEAHYIKNGKTLRGKAVQRLAEGLAWVLLLTGTPVLNRPAELIFPLTVLDRLKELGGSRFFRTRYCGGFDSWGGSTGAANLGELNDAMRASCYVRRMKKDVLKELPPKQRTPMVIPIDNRAEYAQTEADFITWVRDRATRHEKAARELTARCEARAEQLRRLNLDVSQAQIDAEVAEFRKAETRRCQDSAEERALRAEALVRMGVLEQCAVKGKMAAATAWVRDFLSSGEKLVLFCSHTEPLRQLAAEFDAPTISGADTATSRQAAVDRFQTDAECRLLVCNIQSGGVGLTLTAASNVAFLELGWTPAEHDQAEDRCHRIGQHDTVTAWYLLGERTVDEFKAAKLDDKRKVVGAATEGGSVEITSVFGDVLAMLAGTAPVVDTRSGVAHDDDAEMAQAMGARG